MESKALWDFLSTPYLNNHFNKMFSKTCLPNNCDSSLFDFIVETHARPTGRNNRPHSLYKIHAWSAASPCLSACLRWSDWVKMLLMEMFGTIRYTWFSHIPSLSEKGITNGVVVIFAMNQMGRYDLLVRKIMIIIKITRWANTFRNYWCFIIIITHYYNA